LFSGIGGFALAAQWAGFRTIGFCEIDKYCQEIIAKRFPDVPIWTDIKRLTSSSVFDWIELCQDLDKLDTMRQSGSTSAVFQSRTSQTSTQSLGSQCTKSFGGAEPFSGLKLEAVEKIISSVEQKQLIVPRTFLNRLLNAAQSSAEMSANNAEHQGFSGTAEQQSKRTMTTMTDLLKFIGSVRNATTNGTNPTKQTEHNGTRRGTIDLVTGGFP
jgi:hypothetical protein